MRLPWFRLRLRTLLLAVGIVALILGGGILVRRSADYRRLAAFHEQIEQRTTQPLRFPTARRSLRA
jgi:hypothetical protein